MHSKEVIVDLFSEIVELQKLVKESLTKDSENKSVVATNDNLIQNLIKFDNNIMQDCLGDFGIHLHNFVNLVNIQHPTLHSSLFSMFLTSHLFVQINDVLKIVSYAKEVGVDAILKLIKRTVSEKKVVKELMDNVLTTPSIRLLKSRAEREYVREYGVYRTFKMSSSTVPAKSKKNPLAYSDVKIHIKNGDSFWNCQSTTLKHHVRCNNFNAEEIIRTTLMQKHLESCSLPRIANAFNNKIGFLQKLNSDKYYGFHKIGVTNVATSLAKMHGFKVDYNNERIILNPESCRRLIMALSFLLVPNGNLLYLLHTSFGNSCFTCDETASTANIYELLHKIAVEDHGRPATLDADGIALKYIKKISSKLVFRYQSRLYPIFGIKECVPDAIWRVIDQLESFPELDGHALFDNYHVLVPSIDIDNSMFFNASKGQFLFRNGGDIYEFESKDKAYKFLDTHLIQNKLIYPVLLGQCDDKYYFISYLVNLDG